MKSLRCTLHFDEDAMHPVHRRLTDGDSRVREYLLYDHRSDDGLDTLLFYVEGDRERYEAALDAVDQIVEYELTRLDAGEHYAYIREATRAFDSNLRSVLDRPGLLLVPPVEFRSDGTARATVIGEPDALQAALAAVPAEVTVSVDRISGDARVPTTPGIGLTDRQWEAVKTAHAVGYYDVPRTGSVADVAARLDCAPATAAEHLRKAERSIVERAVERAPK
jgi:predicted DNA binding protein